MIWVRSGRMHWTSKDLKGVTMDVLQTDEGEWLFTALSTTAGVDVARSTHNHPLEAMSAGRQLMEQADGKQEEETGSTSQASAAEASC